MRDRTYGQMNAEDAFDLKRIEDAIRKLREARDLLAHAGARMATAKVRRALKSADGARRHCKLRPYRRER